MSGLLRFSYIAGKKVWTTEDMVEAFIDVGTWAYKKLNRGTYEGNCLERHIPVKIDGDITFSCWREYTIYKFANLVRETVPDAQVEVTFDGNDSSIQLGLSEEEQGKLNGRIFSLFREWKIV